MKSVRSDCSQARTARCRLRTSSSSCSAPSVSSSPPARGPAPTWNEGWGKRETIHSLLLFSAILYEMLTNWSYCKSLRDSMHKTPVLIFNILIQSVSGTCPNVKLKLSPKEIERESSDWGRCWGEPMFPRTTRPPHRPWQRKVLKLCLSLCWIWLRIQWRWRNNIEPIFKLHSSRSCSTSITTTMMMMARSSSQEKRRTEANYVTTTKTTSTKSGTEMLHCIVLYISCTGLIIRSEKNFCWHGIMSCVVV